VSPICCEVPPTTTVRPRTASGETLPLKTSAALIGCVTCERSYRQLIVACPGGVVGNRSRGKPCTTAIALERLRELAIVDGIGCRRIEDVEEYPIRASFPQPIKQFRLMTTGPGPCVDRLETAVVQSHEHDVAARGFRARHIPQHPQITLYGVPELDDPRHQRE
jgi:hypothetical protein